MDLDAPLMAYPAWFDFLKKGNSLQYGFTHVGAPCGVLSQVFY